MAVCARFHEGAPATHTVIAACLSCGMQAVCAQCIKRCHAGHMLRVLSSEQRSGACACGIGGACFAGGVRLPSAFATQADVDAAVLTAAVLWCFATPQDDHAVDTLNSDTDGQGQVRVAALARLLREQDPDGRLPAFDAHRLIRIVRHSPLLRVHKLGGSGARCCPRHPHLPSALGLLADAAAQAAAEEGSTWQRAQALHAMLPACLVDEGATPPLLLALLLSLPRPPTVKCMPPALSSSAGVAPRTPGVAGQLHADAEAAGLGLGSQGSGRVFVDLAHTSPPLPLHQWPPCLATQCLQPLHAQLSRQALTTRSRKRPRQPTLDALLHCSALPGVAKFRRAAGGGPANPLVPGWAVAESKLATEAYRDKVHLSLQQVLGRCQREAWVTDLHDGRRTSEALEQARAARSSTAARRAHTLAATDHAPLTGQASAPHAQAQDAAPVTLQAVAADGSVLQPSIGAAHRAAGAAAEDLTETPKALSEQSGPDQQPPELPQCEALLDAPWPSTTPSTVPALQCVPQQRITSMPQLQKWAQQFLADHAHGRCLLGLHAVFEPVPPGVRVARANTRSGAQRLGHLLLVTPSNLAVLDVCAMWRCHHTRDVRHPVVVRYTDWTGPLAEPGAELTDTPLAPLHRLFLDPRVLKVTSDLASLAPVCDADFGLHLVNAFDVLEAAEVAQVSLSSGPAGDLAAWGRAVAESALECASCVPGLQPVQGCSEPVLGAAQSLLWTAHALWSTLQHPATGPGAVRASQLQASWAAHTQSADALPLGTPGRALSEQSPAPEWEEVARSAPLTAALRRVCFASQALVLTPAARLFRGVHTASGSQGGFTVDDTVLALPSWHAICPSCRGQGHFPARCPLLAVPSAEAATVSGT